MQRLLDRASTLETSVDEVQPANTAIQRELDVVSQIASSQIGRRLSTASGLDEKTDPRLDPKSSDFDYQLWTQQALRAMVRSGFAPPSQGLMFANLCVSGAGSVLQYQETLMSIFTIPFRKAAELASPSKSHSQKRRILNSFDGLLKSGELLLVLGRPGSGCSTFLKAICGHLGGLTLEPESCIQFEGIGFEDMIKYFRGEVAYNQEIDTHFAHLTVGETLTFAASARAPRRRIKNMTRNEYIELMVDVVLAVFDYRIQGILKSATTLFAV
jgi:hypothetical protein